MASLFEDISKVKDWNLHAHILKALTNATAAKLEGVVSSFHEKAFDNIIEAVQEFVNGPDTDKSNKSSESIQIPLKKVYDALVKSGTIKPLAMLYTSIAGMIVIAKGFMDTAAVTAQVQNIQPLMAAVRPSLLGAADFIEAEYRGLISQDDTNKMLALLGFPDDQIDLIRQNYLFKPGGHDIVSFAVREAYDDGIASRFGQDDNLSEVLKASEKDRKAAGLDDDTFKLFWRAHWDLPGIGQAFEMFQRGLIQKEDLDKLLRAKDVMPFWREKLLGISYNLLTRVDVRRMHKLGIMRPNELTDAYRKMGHSPEDAEKLTKFTIEYNKDPEDSEKTEADKSMARERDLTKSDILAAYRSKLLEKDKTMEMLKNIGYSEIETDILVSREDRKLEEKLLTQTVAAYEKLYKKGVATKEDIQKDLESFALPGEYIKNLFLNWDTERAADVDMPSKADILRWFKKKFIEEDYAVYLLQSINVPDDFIPFYIKDQK